MSHSNKTPMRDNLLVLTQNNNRIAQCERNNCPPCGCLYVVNWKRECKAYETHTDHNHVLSSRN